MNSGSWRGKWTAEEQNKRCSNSETQTVIYGISFGSNEKGRTRNWHISLSAWPSNKLDCIWSIAEFWPSIVLSVRKPQRKQTEVWKLEVRAEPMQTIFHKWQCRNLPGKTTKWQWRAVSAAATGYRHQNPVFKKENQKYYKDMARSLEQQIPVFWWTVSPQGGSESCRILSLAPPFFIEDSCMAASPSAITWTILMAAFDLLHSLCYGGSQHLIRLMVSSTETANTLAELIPSHMGSSASHFPVVPVSSAVRSIAIWTCTWDWIRYTTLFNTLISTFSCQNKKTSFIHLI